MRRLLMLALVVSGVLALAPDAHAKIVEYMGQHPVARRHGGGFCYIDVPHVHNYKPDEPRLYREINGQLYFVGDPVPYEYDGPRYSFYGPHPVVQGHLELGRPVYCYLKGPHYHWYQPPPHSSFELSGGAYWYVGEFPPLYYQEQPSYVVINEVYAPLPYARPVVEARFAPPAFHGEIVVGGPGWHAGAAIGVPAPVQIGVGINLGGPPVVVEHRPFIEDHRHHHPDRFGPPHGPWHREPGPSRWHGPGPAPGRAVRHAPAHPSGWAHPVGPGHGHGGGFPGPAPGPRHGGRPQHLHR